MVSVVPPTLLLDASPLQFAVGAFVATIITYKLLFPSPAPHEAYAMKHGLTNIKLAKRLPQTRLPFGDLIELSQNLTRFADWIHEKNLEMHEQPWVPHVPSLPDTIIVTTPELVEDVVKTQNDVFGTGEFTRTIFRELVGNGFFNLEGDAWFHQRRIASKFFSPRMFRDVATATCNKNAEMLYAVLEKSRGFHEPVNLTKHSHELAFQNIAQLSIGLKMDLIGSEHGHPLDHALHEALAQVFYRVQTPTWIWKTQRFLSIGGERKYRQVTVKIRRIVGEMVSKSLAQAQAHARPGLRAEPTNIIELYIQAMENDPTEGTAQITPDTLRDIVSMFVIAGSDTVADTLNWIFFMLSKHPRVEQTLREELWAKVPELMRGEIKMLTIDQTQSLTYLDAVIKETLRLHPPGPLAMRQAERDTHLVDGTFVPKGATVGMLPYVMGRLRSIWGDDSLEFKPDRFIDAATGRSRVVSPYAFFSFSAGPRVCIDKHLAMLQMKLLIATLLSRFRLDMLPNNGSYKIAATMILKNPLMACIHRVEALPQ